jgi:FixJ family two-component response regulator
VGDGVNDEDYYQTYLNRDRLIHIVGSDPATCEALSILFRLEAFQTSFSVEASSFIASIERRMPDAVVLNLQVGPINGLTLLHRIKAMQRATPVFMLSDTPQLESVVTAMKLGASDVLGKPVDTERLLTAVRDGLRRDVHLNAMQNGRRSLEVRGFAQLTPREREVLQLISDGQSNKEAGQQLGISPRTVEVHRARVMEKLGARNTADLMRIVLSC